MQKRPLNFIIHFSLLSPQSKHKLGKNSEKPSKLSQNRAKSNVYMLQHARHGCKWLKWLELFPFFLLLLHEFTILPIHFVINHKNSKKKVVRSTFLQTSSLVAFFACHFSSLFVVTFALLFVFYAFAALECMIHKFY